MLRARSLFLSICVLMLATVGSAGAQEFRATVKGQVADTSDAALPGATVTVQNQDTNEIATAVTNTEGAYTLPFLRPGLYTLTVEMSGFQKNIRKDMRLEVGQVATVNVQLGVGLTETVNVSSEAPLLETSRADRGQVIDSARIAELPLQSRSPMALAVLVAGVNYNAQAIYLRPFDNGALADFSMNGGQNRNNEFLLDGVPNNANQDGNNIAYVPPAEAVQEFKVATNSYDAQYGRTAGGVVNMSLKSGTNAFHGVGYEFYRRKWLDSNSFLLNARNAPKTDHYLDQYGGILDGPIIKNKTFFMFTGEKYREGTPAPLFSTVPTDAMKAGDFSGLVDAQGRQIVVYDPATGRDVNGVWTRDPFPGNRIPADRINPAARAIMQYYPSPNGVTAGVAPWQQNLHYAEHFNKDLFWNWVGKVDHNFSPNDRTYFRWAENERNEVRNTSAVRSGPAQDGQLPLIRSNRAIVGDWVHVFGGGTVFNVRGGYTYYLDWSQSDASFGFDSTEFGWPQSLVSQFPSQGLGGMFPRIEMADFVDAVARHRAEPPQKLLDPAEHLADARPAQHPQRPRCALDQRLPRQLRQRRRASSTSTSSSPAAPSTAPACSKATPSRRSCSARPVDGEVPVNAFTHYQWFFIAPWIQDDWRVSDKLTVNLGFRWDGNGAVREEENRLNYAFDPTLTQSVGGVPVIGGVRFVGVDGAPETPWKYDKNNFQLRAGMAYSINEKTVLRGGYGKYYLNPTARSFSNGFNLATPVIASNDDNRTPTYALANPWPNGIQEPPGSSLGPRTFLGRNPGFSNPDFVVPNVASVLGWCAARTTLGSRPRGELCRQPHQGDAIGVERVQRAVGRVPASVRPDARRQPGVLRPAAAQPVLPGTRVRGHDAVHQPDALTLRAVAAVPGVLRLRAGIGGPAVGQLHEHDRAQRRQHDLRLGAVRRQQALHQGHHRQRDLHLRPALERERHRQRRPGLHRRRVDDPRRWSLLLAPQAPHHRLGRVGDAVAARPHRLGRPARRRLVDRADVHLPVRAALGHPGQRRARRSIRPWRR